VVLQSSSSPQMISAANSPSSVTSQCSILYHNK
jgi:hypothetical protein